MGLIDRLRWRFSAAEYVAHVDGDGDGVTAATIESTRNGQELTVEFAEPVKDGNDIARLNFLRDGTMLLGDDLYAGETSYSVQFDSFTLDHHEFDVALVDSEGQVQHRNTVRLE